MTKKRSERIDLAYDQTIYLVVGGEREEARMLTEGGNLVAFESLWHAGPLVHDLEELGMSARTVCMHLEGLFCLAEGMDLGLWILRHDGTIVSIDDIIFP